MSQTRLVTVATYPQAYQAHLVRALLADAGILCFVEGAFGNLTPADGGVRVRVPENAVEEAQFVLRSAGDPLAGGLL